MNLENQWKEVSEIPKETKNIICPNCKKNHNTNSYFWYVQGIRKGNKRTMYWTCDLCGKTFEKTIEY